MEGSIRNKTNFNMKDKPICPQPKVWHAIHTALLEAWRTKKDESIPKPPVPLILNGWVFSSDIEKEVRWKETISWATQYGFTNLIPKLTEEESYFG